MQVSGAVLCHLQVNAFVLVVMVVNHHLMCHQMRQPVGLSSHLKWRDPRQRLPEHDSDEDEGVVGATHAVSVGKAKSLTDCCRSII